MSFASTARHKLSMFSSCAFVIGCRQTGAASKAMMTRRQRYLFIGLSPGKGIVHNLERATARCRSSFAQTPAATSRIYWLQVNRVLSGDEILLANSRVNA